MRAKLAAIPPKQRWLVTSEGAFSYLCAILVSALVGGGCGFLSAFVTLKGWSLMGDALSHAVVPGVALAYILGLRAGLLHPNTASWPGAGERPDPAANRAWHSDGRGKRPLAQAAALTARMAAITA